MDLVKVVKKATDPAPSSASPTLMLSAEQIQLANIRVDTIGYGSSAAQKVLAGTVAFNANQTETISSRVEGRIEKLYIKRVPCLKALCGTIALVWVDGGYRGEDLLRYVNKLWRWVWQVVLRSEDAKGFQLLPRRWVVERTFAWLLNARRLNRGGGPQRLRKKPTKQPKHGLPGHDFGDAQPTKLGFKTAS